MFQLLLTSMGSIIPQYMESRWVGEETLGYKLGTVENHMNLKLARITLKRPKTPRKHKYRRSKSFFIKFLLHISNCCVRSLHFPNKLLHLSEKIVTQCDGFQVAWVTCGLTWHMSVLKPFGFPVKTKSVGNKRRGQTTNY